MARRARRGTRPGEKYRDSLVRVWPKSEFDPENPQFEGRPTGELIPWEDREDNRPHLYVVIVRRLDLEWHHEVIRTWPRDEIGEADRMIIPAEVYDRIKSLRDSIITEQRSERSAGRAPNAEPRVEEVMPGLYRDEFGEYGSADPLEHGIQGGA